MIDDVKRCTTTCHLVNLLSLLTSTNFCFRCTYSNMHHGTHIFGRWSSICTWTSCQTPQFLSGCNPRNSIHLWRQNYRRILCWPWSRLSTFSCLRSSLGVWGKKFFKEIVIAKIGYIKEAISWILYQTLTIIRFIYPTYLMLWIYSYLLL